MEIISLEENSTQIYKYFTKSKKSGMFIIPFNFTGTKTGNICTYKIVTKTTSFIINFIYMFREPTNITDYETYINNSNYYQLIFITNNYINKHIVKTINNRRYLTIDKLSLGIDLYSYYISFIYYYFIINKFNYVITNKTYYYKNKTIKTINYKKYTNAMLYYRLVNYIIY
jgi:hypothetical protein